MTRKFGSAAAFRTSPEAHLRKRAEQRIGLARPVLRGL
jgi:hypothetical protein